MNIDIEKILQTLRLRPRPKTEDEKRHGTFNRRMIAISIDSFVIALIAWPFAEIMAPMSSVSFSHLQEAAANAIQQQNGGEAARVYYQGLQESGAWAMLMSNVEWQCYMFALYAVVCWHFWSSTPGKMLCRLRIVDAKTGAPIGHIQSIMRLAGYCLSLLPCGLGFLWIAIDKKRRGWHDFFAGTQVIISTPQFVRRSNSRAPSRAE